MGYHGVQVLCLSVKLDGINVLFVAIGAVFFIFVLPLLGVILGLFLDYFALLRRVPGAMHQ